jgi:hypothetical protein
VTSIAYFLLTILFMARSLIRRGKVIQGSGGSGQWTGLRSQFAAGDTWQRANPPDPPEGGSDTRTVLLALQRR